MVTIANDRGVELTRQIVGVGAIKPGEQRKFTVAVEVFAPPETPDSEKGDVRTTTDASRGGLMRR